MNTHLLCMFDYLMQSGGLHWMSTGKFIKWTTNCPALIHSQSTVLRKRLKHLLNVDRQKNWEETPKLSWGSNTRFFSGEARGRKSRRKREKRKNPRDWCCTLPIQALTHFNIRWCKWQQIPPHVFIPLILHFQVTLWKRKIRQINI